MDAAQVCTAAEIDRLTPDERQRLVNEQSSTDLSDVPEQFVAKSRAEGRRLLVERNVIAADDQ
jgi:hypothetical protein